MEIRVCSRGELAREAYHPFEKKTAVISIVDSDAEPVVLKHQPHYLLRQSFDDFVDTYDFFEDCDDVLIPVLFSEDQAQEIVSFVNRCKDDVDLLICQCEFGQSRSAAVAAAVADVIAGNGKRFFEDNRYSPNRRVFEMLRKAFGS